jgi:hypothetical protein
VDAEAVRDAAAQILVCCYPLLLMDGVRRTHAGQPQRFHLVTGCGENVPAGLAHEEGRMVVTSAWIDVSNEPVVLHVPHTRGRYFNLTLTDTAGEPFASLGSRTWDATGMDLVLVGPRWHGELAEDFEAKRAPCEQFWTISRIQARSNTDRLDVLRLARRQRIVSLSEIDHPPPAPPMPELAGSSWIGLPPKLDPEALLLALDEMIERAPVSYRRRVRATLSDLLAELGGPPRPGRWSPEFAAAMSRGFADGAAVIQSATGGPTWRLLPSGSNEGSADLFATAALARARLGAPMRKDRMALASDRDDQGMPLSGSGTYRLHFAEHALPPVHGFWSLSVVSRGAHGETFNLGSGNDLIENPDGSLDVIVRRAPPGVDEVLNWLPAPEGPFEIVMHLYTPRMRALSGIWRLPIVERLDVLDRDWGVELRAPSRRSAAGGSLRRQ